MPSTPQRRRRSHQDGGGRITLLVNPEPNALINFATTAGAEQKISPKVTERLLSYDFDVGPQAQLAMQWTISADGREYLFKLRQNVRWHDGKPFTSKDVATSIGLLKQHHSRGHSTFANVIEVATPDAHTAVQRLSKPAPYLIYALAASESPILPAHLYGGSDPLSNPHNINPVGTGPFIFKNWARTLLAALPLASLFHPFHSNPSTASVFGKEVAFESSSACGGTGRAAPSRCGSGVRNAPIGHVRAGLSRSIRVFYHCCSR